MLTELSLGRHSSFSLESAVARIAFGKQVVDVTRVKHHGLRGGWSGYRDALLFNKYKDNIGENELHSTCVQETFNKEAEGGRGLASLRGQFLSSILYRRREINMK